MIAGLRVHRVPLRLRRPFVTAVRSADLLTVTLVEAVDGDGASGWGEAAVSWRVTGESPDSVVAVVEQPLTEVVVGRSPDDPELADRIRNAVWGNAAARSAVECAITDLAAVRAGVTFADMIGAPSTPVRTDLTLSAGTPSTVAEAAADADGYAAIKLKATADTDLPGVVAAVREVVGDDVALRIDANQAWAVDEAIARVRAVERFGIEFVEQPVAAGDRVGLARVRASIGVPVLADEAVRTVHDVHELARLDAADAINVKLAKTGGIAEALRVITAARDAGIGVIVGCMLESIVGVAAAAAIAAHADAAACHDLDAGLLLAASPVIGGASYDGDRIVPARGAGLGITGLRMGVAA